MQLPRGRFEKFVRGDDIKTCLFNLSGNNFTGCCFGIFGETQAEIVFENGDIILAESSEKCGDSLLNSLILDKECIITVELSLYNDAQIKLAKEFNSKCSVDSETSNSFFSSLENNSDKSKNNTSDSLLSLKTEDKTQNSAEYNPSGDNSADNKRYPENKKSDVKNLSEKINRSYEKNSKKPLNADNLETDEDFLLSIDKSEIESIEKDFRLNAAEILKRIHLDHLITDKNNGDTKK